MFNLTHRTEREQGAALIIALLILALLSGIVGALVTVSATETLISANYRHTTEASHAAEAALERALHDLAGLPDWTPVVAEPPANLMSSFVDGLLAAVAPDGRRLDLSRLTIDRQRESDARDGSAVFGADAPAWRLYAHGSLQDLLASGEIALPMYLAVWVADDGLDGDGDPGVDANGRIVVHAEAFGVGGTRRVVEAAVRRLSNGAVRQIAWREVR